MHTSFRQQCSEVAELIVITDKLNTVVSRVSDSLSENSTAFRIKN